MAIPADRSFESHRTSHVTADKDEIGPAMGKAAISSLLKFSPDLLGIRADCAFCWLSVALR